MTTLLAIGLGYSANAVARRFAPSSSREAVGQLRNSAGWRIIGSARGEDGLADIRASGCEAVAFDGNAPSPALSAAIAEATHVLISVPPDGAGDPVLRHHAEDLARAPGLVWAGYLSTIGVYGDHGGGWVDEATPPRPVSERSHWRLAAEEAWAQFAEARGLTLQIFRLAGIYGPGRNALAQLKSGRERRIDKPGQVFNRIHVEDIAGVVEAGIHAGSAAAGIFNVTDDEPAPPQNVSAFAAELLGAPPLPLVPWEEAQAAMSPMARSFYAENRRVRNARIKEVLGVRLRYPTYREGLRALAAASAE